MAQRGAIDSITHNIALHAASGLSYLQPYTGQVSRAKNLAPLVLDLLASDPLGGIVGEFEPFGLSSRVVQKKFWEIVEKEGIKQSQVRSAILEFLFPTFDNYYTVCTCKLTDTKGKQYSMTVPTV